MDGYINDFGIANMAAGAGRGGRRRRAERYAEEAEYFRNRALNYVHMFDPAVGLLPGPGLGRRLAAAAGPVRPAGLGLRLHRDQRLEHGVPRAAGRPGPGQPVRRQGRAGRRSWTTFFATPETAELPRLVRRRRSTRCSRPATCGWASTATATSRRTTSSTCTTTPVSRGRRRRRSARRCPGSTWAARSARATPATRTTARCRRGTSSARSASTRCRWAARTYAIGSPLFTKATVNLENGKKIVINAPNNSATNVYVQALKVNGKAYDNDVAAARRCSPTARCSTSTWARSRRRGAPARRRRRRSPRAPRWPARCAT